MPLGTNTSAPNIGSGFPNGAAVAWPGAVTVPVIVVFGWLAHAFCWRHRPVHGNGAHVFAIAPTPHTSSAGHVPQFGVSPPHPSATRPQLAPASAQVRGVHGLAPQLNC